MPQPNPIDFQKLFRSALKRQKDVQRDVFHFTLSRSSHSMQKDISQGIKDTKVFRDRIAFTGKLFDTPKVEILYKDIEKISIEYDGEGNIEQVYVKAPPSRKTTWQPSGPDR